MFHLRYEAVFSQLLVLVLPILSDFIPHPSDNDVKVLNALILNRKKLIPLRVGNLNI